MKTLEELNREFQIAYGLETPCRPADEPARPDTGEIPGQAMQQPDNIEAILAELKIYLDEPNSEEIPLTSQPASPVSWTEPDTSWFNSLDLDILPDSTLNAAAKPDKRYSSPQKSVFSGFLRFLIIAVIALSLIFYLSAVIPGMLDYSRFDVASGSMQREIPKGSLVIAKHVDPVFIKIGDNITYRRQDGSTVTHKVMSIIENVGGSTSRGFITKGTENTESDPYTVLAGDVVGVVQVHIAGLGTVLSLLNKLIWVLLIATAVVTLIAVLRRRSINLIDKRGKK